MRTVSLLVGLLGLFYAVAGTALSLVPRNFEVKPEVIAYDLGVFVQKVKQATTVPLYKTSDAIGTYQAFFSVGNPG